MNAPDLQFGHAARIERLAGMPAAMRERPQWLLWRAEQGPDDPKPRKVPYYADGRRRVGAQGSDADRAALVTFDKALAALRTGKRWSGLGFAFLPGDGLVGIDVDGAVDPETGEPSELCANVIEWCASYTERSPSGRGVHIIVQGETRTFKDNTLGVEVFCGSQFFTCTGDAWPGTPREVQTVEPEVLAYLRELVDESKARARAASRPPAPAPALAVSRASGAESDDFRRVNEAALCNLAAWVLELFPRAKPWPSTGGYRVTSKDLGRELQEDLSFTPEGIQDFGREHGMTPIDVVIEWSPQHRKPAEALRWLAGRCGVTLSSGGDRQAREGRSRQAPAKGAKGREPASGGGAAVGASEDALALALVERHGHDLRRSPGLEWMLNLGDHWARDEQLRRFDWARAIARETALAAGDAKLATRLGSAKTVAGIIMLAQSDPRIALPADAWDADPMALNTPGGVIDLRTGKVRSRGGEYHTQIARTAPDATMLCPLWSRFIAEVFLGDLETVEFVQRLLGYMLTGDRREQQLFFWYGLGANGKSTLADIVQWILGSYAVKLPATTLMQTGIGQHPTELAQLRGKRLAMSSEIDEGLYWNESRIKELTGDETLTARFMRQDFFEFRMTQKHVIVGNYKPRMRGGDAALARRFVLVPFNAKFQGMQRDPRMLEKLRAEAPAILAWMVQGAIKWADSGLAIPSSVTAASAEYMTDNDDVALWLDECCVRSPDAEARGGDLYESFACWIKARGQHAPSMRVWADRMNVVPGVVRRRSNGTRYAGVRLTAEEANRLTASTSGWAR